MDVQLLFQLTPKSSLSAKGYNKRSSEHLNLYGNSDFNKNFDTKNYLLHEDINNLKGLEVELIFKWKIGRFANL